MKRGLSSTGPDVEAVRGAASGDPAAIPALVRELVEGHGAWNASSLNLVASHNYMSAPARELLASDAAQYVLSGELGARAHAGGAWIDALDGLAVQLCKRLFDASEIEYRPMSGALANGVALFTMTKPGDIIMALPAEYGGHHTYREGGYAGAIGLRVHDIPYDVMADAIDLDRLARAAELLRPRLIVVGTPVLLFPYPLREIRDIADRVDCPILYDGAHILGLVAGNEFQHPLREGATVLTGSTQKTLGGPIGGLLMTNDSELGAQVRRMTSAVISNYHNNRIAALAVTLAEMAAFGPAFASQVVRNARELAYRLDMADVPVVARDRGYTRSHLLLVETTKLEAGQNSFERLEAARILTTKTSLPHTYPMKRDLRIGVAAVTRLGMKEKEMTEIASLVRRVLVDQESPTRVATDVGNLVTRFPTLQYCF